MDYAVHIREVTILSGSHQQTGEMENGDVARREILLGRLNSIILDLETAIQNIHDAKKQMSYMATGAAADALSAALEKQISILHGTISFFKQVMKGV